MSTYIETNSDGVIYVQIDETVIGIVNALIAVSVDGIRLSNSAIHQLECLTDLEEDFDNETTTLTCINADIVFCGGNVTVIEK